MTLKDVFCDRYIKFKFSCSVCFRNLSLGKKCSRDILQIVDFLLQSIFLREAEFIPDIYRVILSLQFGAENGGGSRGWDEGDAAVAAA